MAEVSKDLYRFAGGVVIVAVLFLASAGALGFGLYCGDPILPASDPSSACSMQHPSILKLIAHHWPTYYVGYWLTEPR